jgi:hypothetical protein
MKDFLIADMAGGMAASKNRTYRDEVRQSFTVLATFFQANKLTTRSLMESDAIQGDQFKIMRSDLTDEGYEVID